MTNATNLTIGQITADELYTFAQANYTPQVMELLIDMLGFTAFLDGAKSLMEKEEADRMSKSLRDFYPQIKA